MILALFFPRAAWAMAIFESALVLAAGGMLTLRGVD